MICMIKFLFHFKLLYLNLSVVKKVFFYKQCLFLIMSDMHMMVANPEKVMCYLRTFKGIFVSKYILKSLIYLI